MRYFAFIDDSGTKEYAAKPEDYRPSGNSRYFVFGSVLVTEDDAATLGGRIAEIKRVYFGSADIEVKSNWLRIPRERSRRYLQPYRISEDRLTEFVNEFYDLVIKAELVLLAAVVDKPEMQRAYENPWYAPAVAYEFLAQRISQHVSHTDTVAIVVDDMSGATPKGNQHKANLHDHHRRLVKWGSKPQPTLSFRHFEERLIFYNSAKSHMLQVADVAAYNVYRQFVDHGPDWEIDSVAALPTYEWFAKLAPKFRRDSGGRIQGYGIVKAPLLRRVPWGLAEKK